jgi:hypothetical protein
MAKINIDLSQLKGLLKGLGSLRAFSTLLWPIVIVAAGVVILATALLLGAGLTRKVTKQRMPMNSQLTGLLETAPAIRQAEEEKLYQDAYENDANLIERLSIQTTQRELLDYDIFPQPKDTSEQLFREFGNRFRQQIENLTTSVNGVKCPSEEELASSLQKATTTPGYGGGAMTTAGTKEEKMVIEQICQARAKAGSVYASPEFISGYSFWSDYQYSTLEDSVKDCWFWQLGYWIIEDVFATVEKMNSGSSGVEMSPVKRMMRIGFETPDKLLAAKEDALSKQAPKYVTKPEDQLTISLTGRTSSQTEDIVHFGVAAIVRTSAVLEFMKELCSEKQHVWKGYSGTEAEQTYKHNQITILESRVTSITPESPEHQRYRYGQEPVAQVELVCEYIFNKKGYEPIYPEVMKEKTAEAPAEVM